MASPEAELFFNSFVKGQISDLSQPVIAAARGAAFSLELGAAISIMEVGSAGEGYVHDGWREYRSSSGARRRCMNLGSRRYIWPGGGGTVGLVLRVPGSRGAPEASEI